MVVVAGLESYNFGILHLLCHDMGWTRPQGIIHLVRESKSFNDILADCINHRLDKTAISGIVRNRPKSIDRKTKIKMVNVSGFEKAEILAISHYALVNEMTISCALEKLLLESPTFLEAYNGRTFNSEAEYEEHQAKQRAKRAEREQHSLNTASPHL